MAEPAQLRSLNLFDDYLAELSGPKDERFWQDPAALDSDMRWQRIRELARDVLTTFDWPYEPPPRDGATYVDENGVVVENI